MRYFLVLVLGSAALAAPGPAATQPAAKPDLYHP
jgi:hypothetical protein